MPPIEAPTRNGSQSLGFLASRQSLSQIEPLADNDSTDELWHQLKSFQILEESLSESEYKTMVRLMAPGRVIESQLGKNPLAFTHEAKAFVPPNEQESLLPNFANPAFRSEFLRRQKVMKDFLFGRPMQPAFLAEDSADRLPEDALWDLKVRAQSFRLMAQQTELSNWGPFFHTLCEDIHRHSKAGNLSADQAVDLMADFGFALSTKTLMGQSLWRPRGYAGTFDMMEAIYRFYDTNGQLAMGDPSLEPWNRALLSTTSAEDVNDRKTVIVDDMIRDRAQALTFNEPLAVLNFASGPGRLEQDFIDTLGSMPSQVKWECIDGDAQAVEFAQARLKDQSNITVKEGNVVRELANKDRVGQYDEVLTVGLLDYFNDKFTIKALAHFYNMLKPGGTFRIGQFSSNHADEAFLEFTNWYLYRRDENHMRELLAEAQIPPGLVEIKKISDNGPQLIVTAQKPK